MKRPDRCPRCGGLGTRYTIPGVNVMKLTVAQLLTAKVERVKCQACEGTGNAAPVVSLGDLRLMQAAG